MTRMHDDSPPPLRQSSTSVQGAGASDRTAASVGLVPSGSDEPPPRHVLVSYDEFTQRRQLRLRLKAAFERLERARTLEGESRTVTPVQAPTTDDETP
jgi:hypothetical protein